MHPSGGPALDPRYPIGPPKFPAAGPEVRSFADIAQLPSRLTAALNGLNPTQLDTPYRDGGWTLRQVAHHVADSHLNAYTRLRLALTEDWPVIQPYDEALWANLADAHTLPVEVSLELLGPLHARWTSLLGSLEEGDWLRGYMHSEMGRTSVEKMTALYSWHGRHHTAHVLGLRERMGW